MRAFFLRLSNTIANHIRYFFIYSPSILFLSPVKLLAAIERVAPQRNSQTSLPSVCVGDRVLVWDLHAKTLLKLTLVAGQQSNPEKGLLSVCSGLGIALLGKHPGSYCHVSIFHKKHAFRLLLILNGVDEHHFDSKGEMRHEEAIMPLENLHQY
ncbi:GreA/GreB family elongation factor [Bowmanella pacifica]|uniref:Transcription elongation factor GreA/GreB C-terminal domain-containing protein n=1 Tax=Bowmanella pacifica TaxID=502051 RepID=A0A917Z6Y4_9ALTE|nr:GreA/GreB family elongation factor [Bowmanella pacifica]GGO74774.1 hypothetical protein GCM10010982_38400 [Bowmanella pacifica]